MSTKQTDNMQVIMENIAVELHGTVMGGHNLLTPRHVDLDDAKIVADKFTNYLQAKAKLLEYRHSGKKLIWYVADGDIRPDIIEKCARDNIMVCLPPICNLRKYIRDLGDVSIEEMEQFRIADKVALANLREALRKLSFSPKLRAELLEVLGTTNAGSNKLERELQTRINIRNRVQSILPSIIRPIPGGVIKLNELRERLEMEGAPQITCAELIGLIEDTFRTEITSNLCHGLEWVPSRPNSAQ